MSEPTICCICEKPVDIHYTPDGVAYWTTGHNAAPLGKGRACDSCNQQVIAHRMQLAMFRRFLL